ncbi:MBL fold metallo-hydrolase [Streptomyces capparidis]
MDGRDVFRGSGAGPARDGGFARRWLLRGAVAAGAAVPVARAVPAAAAEPGRRSRTATGSATFRWLGTSGWRIDIGERTVLFDPYLSRFETGLFAGPGRFDPATRLTTRPDVVDRHAGRPEVILVSHSHWDHFADVPYLAKAVPTARIVGTETTYHLLRAYGVDGTRISVVRGGEVLDFGGFTVEVVSSLHSRNKSHSYFEPGTLHGVPAEPTTIAHLPEGDTLAFQVAVAGGPSAFLMGASDINERNAAGLRPDVAMVAVPSSTSTHRYAARLMRALGNPGVVVPVHWDNFETSIEDPVLADPTMRLAETVDQIRRLSPGTQIVMPQYLTPYRF